MSRGLVRFARRLANWEDPALSVDELQEREFKARDGGPDLRPSVYDLEQVESLLVQTYAEHAHRFDPPRSALAIDVAEAVSGSLEATRGDTPFRHTQRQHREVVLGDREELLSFIRKARAAPRHDVSRNDVRAYVRQKLAGGDDEWRSLADAPDVIAWVRKIATSG